MDLASLIPALEGTLIPDTAKSRAAAAALEEASAQPGFALALFAVCADPGVGADTRMVAATYVKNHIKRHWVSAAEGGAHAPNALACGPGSSSGFL